MLMKYLCFVFNVSFLFTENKILTTSQNSAGNSAGNSGNTCCCFILVVVISSSLLSVTREDCALLPCPDNFHCHNI